MTSDQERRPPTPADGAHDRAQVRAALRVWDRWVARFAGSDPGLNRFRLALQSVLTVAVILEAEWLFVRFTHVLQIQAPGFQRPGRPRWRRPTTGCS